MRPILHCALTCSCVLLAANFGCKKADESSETSSAAESADRPAAQPTAAPDLTGMGDKSHTEDVAKPNGERPAPMPGKTLELEGLSLAVPEGWKPKEIQPGPFAAVAAFTLPRAEGDSADGSVRITHYPNMKGMDDMNIDRWLAQVTHDDGSRYSREEAKFAVREMGNVRLKTLDMTGNVQATMADAPQPNSRMIAAIVDHPKGPHFIIVSGKIGTINQWEGSVSAFLKSATVK
jgi:hypothetical protein